MSLVILSLDESQMQNDIHFGSSGTEGVGYTAVGGWWLFYSELK
jgi:hypothetical protein